MPAILFCLIVISQTPKYLLLNDMAALTLLTVVQKRRSSNAKDFPVGEWEVCVTVVNCAVKQRTTEILLLRGFTQQTVRSLLSTVEPTGMTLQRAGPSWLKGLQILSQLDKATRTHNNDPIARTHLLQPQTAMHSTQHIAATGPETTLSRPISCPEISPPAKRSHRQCPRQRSATVSQQDQLQDGANAFKGFNVNARAEWDFSRARSNFGRMSILYQRCDSGERSRAHWMKV